MPRSVWAGVLFIVWGASIVAAADRSTGPILAGGDRNFPPYEFLNARGEPDGFNVDLLKAIADRLDLEVTIHLDDWATVRGQLAQGTIRLVTGMVRSAERETQYDFSITHAGIFYCLFIRKGSAIATIDDARGKAIIVHSQAYSHDWLRTRQISDTIIPAASPQEALRLLAEGRHDCAVLERLSALEVLDQLKIGTVAMTGPPLVCAPYAFAVQHGDDDLLARLNEGIHLMHQSGVYEDLYRKWFSVADARARRTALLRAGALVLAIVIGVAAAALVANGMLRRLVRARTAALRRSDKRFHDLSEMLPQTVFETDGQGTITFLNRSGMAMLGLDETAMADGVRLTDMVQPEPVDGSGPAGGDAPGVSCWVRGRGVDGFPALLYTRSFTSADRRAGTRGLLVDVAWQKELEKQLVESQKMEAIGRLAGGVAHDFSNIVTGISAYAQMIRRQPNQTAAVVDSAERILTGCDRASDLVRHFLVTAGRRKPDQQQIRLGRVVAEVFNLLMPTYGRNIVFVNRIPGDDDDTVWAEPAQVFQVLMNLCVNGVQSMADAGGELTVGLWNDAAAANAVDGNHLRMVYVRDTGPGIEAADKAHIFEPFFTTRRKTGGSGIGLFVVSQSLADMGGVIRVESAPGKGATFVVGIPKRPVHRGG